MATTILPMHFRILTLLGVWCPLDWSPRKKACYRVFTMLIVLSFIGLNSGQVAKLFFGKSKSTGEFINFLMFALSMETAAVKGSTYLIKRVKVKRLISMFEADCCLPRDEYERNIRKVYEAKCIKLGLKMFCLFEFLLYAVMLTPLTFDVELRILPYPVLLPYSLAKLRNYWLTYGFQAYILFFMAHIGLVSDLTAISFMWQLCGQFEVLKHRLQKLPSIVTESGGVGNEKRASEYERQAIRDCVGYHVHLFNIAEAITEAFSVYIVFEVYLDALAICFGVYRMSQLSAAGIAEKLQKLFYLSVLLVRLFLNCYFGNEVAVQSVNLADAIYMIDWTPVSLELKKGLFMMILRTSKPVMISSRVFVRLMLDFFIKVVKTSYSGYSLLASTA